jgi:hypothetical protein
VQERLRAKALRVVSQTSKGALRTAFGFFVQVCMRMYAFLMYRAHRIETHARSDT